MNAVCAEPGCGNLLDRSPDRLFCDDHDELNADLAEHYEAEARGVLEESVLDAGAMIRAGLDARLASEIVQYEPAVLRAAERGDAWTAVRHALWVGYMKGLLSGVSDRQKAERFQEAAEALRDLHERWHADGLSGGRPLKEYSGVPAPSGEELRGEYDKHIEKGLAKWKAAELAGRRFGGIPSDTVLRRLREK